MRIFALASTLILVSSFSFARPSTKVNVEIEANEIRQVMANLQDYEQRFWAIGLNGDTLQPDAFLRFFADRELTFHYFVRSSNGVVLGDADAYRLNIEELNDYRNLMITEEIAAVVKTIEILNYYQEQIWAVGLNGNTLQPDSFIQFFGERSLPFVYFVDTPVLTLGDYIAYDQNRKTLNDYMQRIKSLVSSSGSL